MKLRFLYSLVCLLVVVCILSGCSSSGRTGYGPYDSSDYSVLDAQMDLNDYRSGN